MLGIAVGALTFVATGIYFAVDRQSLRLPLWVIVISSYIGVPFFGLGFIYACYRLFVPKPLLIINRDGIFDNASAVGAGMLRWEEIAEIFTYTFWGERFLGIIPINPETVMNRQSSIKRFLMKLNRGLKLAPINIPQPGLPMSVDELQSMIEEYRSRLNKR
ncbi:MAG: STM3941 family protein [Acidobacteriota bacterium]